MAASWSGAIEFAGFPVNVALHNRVKSRSGESFKTLAPDGNPVKSQYVDSTGEVVDRANTRKGVEVSKGQFAPLSAEAVEAIGNGARSKVVQPDTFSPLATIPLELALTSYSVVPDPKVPGSEKSTNIVWNGLRKSGLAYTTVLATSASRDAVLVVWATDVGLLAATLPFAEELNAVPAGDFTEDAAAAKMFEQVVEAQYTTGDFDHASYESECKARRAAVIEQVLAGAEIEAPVAAQQSDDSGDLMAALEAAVDAVESKATKATKTKAKAKVKA